MRRPCDSCRKPYEAKTPRSRFCSDRCRARNQGRPPSGEVVELPAREPEPGSVTRSTLAALEAVGRVDHPAGQAALVLARQLDARADTGSGLAALAREHGARLEVALAGTSASVSPLDAARDELAKRRARKGA